jgi:hypothetical protein
MSARQNTKKRGAASRKTLFLSSGVWLTASLLGRRGRSRQDQQVASAPPTTISQASTQPIESQASADSSPRTTHDAQTGWLGDPRRCATADGLLLVLAAATVAVCLLQSHGAARLLLVLAAACLIPGSALLTRLRVEDELEAAALAVGLGFTIEAAGALVMVWTGWWHPIGWVIVLGAAACTALAIDFCRSVTLARGGVS